MRLQKKGWRIGGVREFLGLSAEETAYVELKVRLAHFLRARRRSRDLTQTQLARLVHSSQSRVAKMEAADPSVTLDLLVRSLLVLGASSEDLASVVAGTAKARRRR